MKKYLIDHAIQNVWCTPGQDKHVIFAAKRITSPSGVLNNFGFMLGRLTLPVQKKRFHIYQVGQLHPAAVGLLSLSDNYPSETWINFSDAMNSLKLHVAIYTSAGVSLPRYKSYYMFTSDKALIFAIESLGDYAVNFSEESVYVRLYTNAYFQTVRSDAQIDKISTRGMDVGDTASILGMQVEFQNFQNLHGYSVAFVNGMMVDGINLANVKVGDHVEYVYDSSIKKMVTFTVKDLPTFQSILDSKYKYLLHHIETSNTTIDYQDDLDIYIVYQDSNGREKGYYYHRNHIASHRMVTHRDYSVVVEFFDYIAQRLSDDLGGPPLDFRELKLKVLIRNSGYERPLVCDNSRLFELYKLSSSQILAALSGLDSSLPLWRAENLENSAYAKVMSGQLSSITLDLVQNAYGYNAISKLIGDTPSKVNSIYTSLPPGLRENSTMYNYDSEGRLLSRQYHLNDDEYRPWTNGTAMFEAISGKGERQPSVTFGINNIPLPIYYNYRVYMCRRKYGNPDENWVDVTGSDKYTVSNNHLLWSDPSDSQYLMVRTDQKFLSHDINLVADHGLIHFTLNEEQDRGAGYTLRPMSVPMGELDIFLNNNSLIRGLDYVVQFPQVIILNKSHLIQPALTSIQRIHIRFTGFCKENLQLDDLEDYGFVEHGVLSNNSRFDIRDDKVLRITMNGKIKHRDDLIFSEEHLGVSSVNAVNGMPYQIKDIVVPLKELVDENTYSLRAKSQAIDLAVSNYMSLKHPQPSRDGLSAIPERYALVSPFISTILSLLESNDFTTNEVNAAVTDMDVMAMCHSYEPLLSSDPIAWETPLDSRYAYIHPTYKNTVTLIDVYQYRFLTRVVRIYANGMISLSPFVAIRN